jgi:2-polyprenyl-6-methoxyphenol hydroxylase-like FAD-dependent oxidoreductase
MTQTRSALVIGGGIAGPVAAMALQRAGIEATVYEAYQTTADGVGAALSIAPNGLAALAVIGADEAVRRIGRPLTGMVLQSCSGKVLAEIPATEQPMQTVWRSDLYRVLYDEAVSRRIRFEHGKRLVNAHETSDEVVADFSDGTCASAGVLIGADGVRSSVRTLIDPAAPSPRYTGLLNFGAMISNRGLSPTEGKMHMIFGKRAFFGYQVYDDGPSLWFANLPHREPMSLTDARAIGAEKWLNVMRDVFAGDRGPALEMIACTPPDDLVIIGGVDDLPTVPTWHSGPMVLIGDAAHATSPSSGQGASLAIESAVQLARCLRDLPHREAFAAYEHLRRDRVERIIAAGARTNSSKAAGPVARVLRDLFMPIAMRAMTKSGALTKQFEYRIDWAAPVASPG